MRAGRARARSRTSSRPRRPASSCACRWRRCWARRRAPAAEGAADGITGFVLLLDNITRRIESRQPARPAAADADAGHARVARQHARGGRDHRVVPRHGQGGAGPVHRHHRRGGAAPERAARPDGGRVRGLAAHRVAARGHARRRPDRGGAAPDRDQARAADEARDRRRLDLAQRGQLLADAGHHLPRGASARRVRHPRDPLRPRKRGAARAPRPDLDRGAARRRDHDGVADRRDGAGRRGVPAHAEADRRAARRRDLVPDRQAVAARVLPHRDPA